MPHSTICVKEDRIYGCNECSNSSEVISNFTLMLTTSVDCDNAESGGPGFLTIVKCFTDKVERECFVPMSELSNLKKFTGYINLEKLRSLCALKKNSSVSSWNS